MLPLAANHIAFCIMALLYVCMLFLATGNDFVAFFYMPMLFFSANQLLLIARLRMHVRLAFRRPFGRCASRLFRSLWRFRFCCGFFLAAGKLFCHGIAAVLMNMGACPFFRTACQRFFFRYGVAFLSMRMFFGFFLAAGQFLLFSYGIAAVAMLVPAVFFLGARKRFGFCITCICMLVPQNLRRCFLCGRFARNRFGRDSKSLISIQC